jgi:1-acyl-sn-glycerol-3-phosphate acyltransferase
VLIPLLINFKINGCENVPKTGGILIVSNHLSVGDPVLMEVFLCRRLNFMAKEELFRNKFASIIIKYFGAFPVYRGSSSRDAVRIAINRLREEKALVMFPEGKRSSENKLRQAFLGSALIGCHCQVPIVPIGISGSEAIKGLFWVWHRPIVTMNIGKLFYLPGTKRHVSKEILEEYTKIVMSHISDLIPDNYQSKCSNE